MSVQFSQLEVRKQRGEWIIQGAGQTPRGQKFIKKQQVIDSKGPADPQFKNKMRQAVAQLYDSEA